LLKIVELFNVINVIDIVCVLCIVLIDVFYFNVIVRINDHSRRVILLIKNNTSTWTLKIDDCLFLLSEI